MTDPIQLRRRVRSVLSAIPKERRLSEELLFDTLRRDFPDLKTTDLGVALGWNQSKGYIDYRYSQDDERKEWFLTAEGWQHEGLG